MSSVQPSVCTERICTMRHFVTTVVCLGLFTAVANGRSSSWCPQDTSSSSRCPDTSWSAKCPDTNPSTRCPDTSWSARCPQTSWSCPEDSQARSNCPPTVTWSCPQDSGFSARQTWQQGRSIQHYGRARLRTDVSQQLNRDPADRVTIGYDWDNDGKFESVETLSARELQLARERSQFGQGSAAAQPDQSNDTDFMQSSPQTFAQPRE